MTVSSRTLGHRIQAAIVAVIVLAALGWWWHIHAQQQVEQQHRACERRNDQGRLAAAMRGEPEWAFRAEDCR